MYKKLPTHRYKKTLEMLKEVCPAPAVIFDLGEDGVIQKYFDNLNIPYTSH